MGPQPIKNKSPKWIIRFLKRHGFVELKNNQGKGDHSCLRNAETKAYTEVDKGRDAFTAREIKAFIKQTGVEEAEWRKG